MSPQLRRNKYTKGKKKMFVANDALLIDLEYPDISNSNLKTLMELAEKHKLSMTPKPNVLIKPQEVKPQRITVSGPATRVLWEDGEQTVVKLCQEDAAYDSAYVAFCIALAKRIYGSNSALHRTVDRHLDSYLIAEQKRIKAEEQAEREKEEAKRHARRVRNLAKKMRLEAEAKALNDAKESGVEVH
jgi:hypothetical protein